MVAVEFICTFRVELVFELPRQLIPAFEEDFALRGAFGSADFVVEFREFRCDPFEFWRGLLFWNSGFRGDDDFLGDRLRKEGGF